MKKGDEQYKAAMQFLELLWWPLLKKRKKTMAKTILKAGKFQGIIEKVNPFGICDENGEPLIFADYARLYYFVLMFAKTRFPKGFIDIPLLLHQLIQISLPDARRLAKRLPFIKTECEIFLCGWEDKESNPKFQAEQLMRALHSLSDTKFSQDFFNWAWEQFAREEKLDIL